MPIYGAYDRFEEGWEYTVVDLADNSTTVNSGPTIIGNIWVETVMSAHACPIQDGTTVVKTLPASSAVNTSWEEVRGLKCKTSLVVDPNDAATGVIHITWKKG